MVRASKKQAAPAADAVEPTPGPWSVGPLDAPHTGEKLYRTMIRGPVARPLALQYHPDLETAEQDRANAQVMAAGREALDLLQRLVDLVDCNEVRGLAVHTLARDAAELLDKAKGRRR